MNPDLLLGVVTALMGFVLKSSLAFGLCLILSWLADSPSRRFIVWLSFLYGSAAYWLYLAKGVIASGQLTAGRSSVPAPAAISQSVHPWQIPGSWAFPLAMALRVVGLAYVLASTYLLVVHIRKHIQLKWVLGFTSRPPEDVVATFQPVAESLGVGRSRLLVLSGVASPATFGWLRPTVLLPDTCLQQDRSDLENIFRHELHHVRRWDFVWNGVAIACRAFLFFHPAAWYALNRMQFDRELACDLAVVSDSPKQRAKYAECLIQFARISSSQSSRNWGIDFAAPSEHLKARVHSILAENKKSAPWLVWSRVACGLVLLAGFVSVAPSVGILLSWAHQQVAQPMAKAEIGTTSPAGTDRRIRAAGRARLSRTISPASGEAALAGVGAVAPGTDLPAEQVIDSPVLTQSSGPQLVHRGSAKSGKSAGQPQTVIPIDDASGQVSKTGDHDHNQALQQTATAAAILRRIGALDRH